jgi:hypothetical protein
MAHSGTDKQLSHYQEQAIPALLSTSTITEAAAVAGVGERTLKRWLAEDAEFVSQYRAVRRQIVEASVSRLVERYLAACETVNLRLLTVYLRLSLRLTGAS